MNSATVTKRSRGPSRTGLTGNGCGPGHQHNQRLVIGIGHGSKQFKILKFSQSVTMTPAIGNVAAKDGPAQQVATGVSMAGGKGESRECKETDPKICFASKLRDAHATRACSRSELFPDELSPTRTRLPLLALLWDQSTRLPLLALLWDQIRAARAES